MSWLNALAETSRSGLKVERKRLVPLVALRGAAGLALVVLLSLDLFGPGVAASSAFGAFSAAVATFQRSWRPRPLLALASGFSLALSTFLGYVCVVHLWIFVPLLMLWAFAAGMAWAAGPTAGIIAASNVSIVMVTVTLPGSVVSALGHAAVIAAGGLVQAGLVWLVPIRRWGAHRDALADALAAVADYARRLRQDPVADFDPEPLMEARKAAVLTPGQARRRPVELRGPRGVAERIRPVLASLADPGLGVPAEGPARERVRELLYAAGTVLDACARAVRRGQPVRVPAATKAVLRTPDTEELLSGPPLRAARRLRALLDDVRDTADPSGGTSSRVPDDARETAAHGMPAVTRTRTRAPLSQQAAGIALLLRLQLRRNSPVFRHGVRISVVAGVGYLLGSLLPLGHPYWAPLTSVMVMRPDFSQTYARAAGRFTGTLLGVTLASLVVRLAHPGTELLAWLAVLCGGLMYLLMRTGYVVAQFCVSMYVVFLLGMAGTDLEQTTLERIGLTLVGGLLAMLAYALYPAWEAPRLRGRLATALLAHTAYAAAVFRAYANPSEDRSAQVRKDLLAARDSRSEWQEAVEKARDEPVRQRGLSRGAADDADEALAQIARVAMLMEAHLPGRGSPPVPPADRLAQALDAASTRAARDLRDRTAPRWDAVRAALGNWDAAGTGEQAPPDRVARKGAGMLVEALEGFSAALAPPKRPQEAREREKTVRVPSVEEEEARRPRAE
ncbi:FUSC family protein [Streptomyces sp. NPDC001054]